MARHRKRKGKRKKQLLDTTGYSIENPTSKSNPTLLEACNGNKNKLYELISKLKKAEGLQVLKTGEIQKFKMSNTKYRQMFGVENG